MSRRTIRLALLIVVLVGPGAFGEDRDGPQPLSCFVIHCEPTKASEESFLALTDLVERATAAAVPLTIDFTAQWAELILESEEKVGTVAQWMADGHEVGCHHHPYWSTQSRAATWDGYTDTPASVLAAASLVSYRGTMDDYMGLLDALPGDRVTACMGLENERDAIDWPCQIRYSTVGHTLEDAVSKPYQAAHDGCVSWQVTHSLLPAQEPGALQMLYLGASHTDVFGVVGHVYNYVDDPHPFIVWFRFLSEADAQAAYRGTVSQVIERWFAENGL